MTRTARAPVIKEQVIEKQICKHLHAKGIFHWKAKTVGTWDAGKNIYRKSAGYMKGVSDLIGLYNGRMLAIEVKSARGRPTPEQVTFQECVRHNGGIAFIARSVEEVQQKLAHWQAYTGEVEASDAIKSADISKVETIRDEDAT